MLKTLIWSDIKITTRAYTVPMWPASQGPYMLLGLNIPHMHDILIGATHDEVIHHVNRVDTATRCLQDMDAVELPNVPDLACLVEAA